VVKRRVLLALFGLCLVLGFSALGNWQWGRGLEKQAMLDAAVAARAEAPWPLSAADTASGVNRAAGGGRFLDTPPLWLDNQRRGPRVGVRLYCAFQPHSGTALLVDLGWLPLPGDRTLPREACPTGPADLAGLLAPPPAAAKSGRKVAYFGQFLRMKGIDYALRLLSSATRKLGSRTGVVRR